MMKKIIDWSVERLSFKKRSFLIYAIIFLFATLPVIFLGVFNSVSEYQEFTKAVIFKKRSIVDLSSILVKERLDHMVDIGKSITSRVLIVDMAKKNKWDDFEGVLEDMMKDSPFIDGVFVADLQGKLLAIAPSSNIVGQDFSYRDWYKGVTKNWEPYVSEVYKRANDPKYNIVSVALPIKDPQGNILAILAMQVKLDVFFEWINDFRTKGIIDSGFLYFIDKSGHVIAHPDVSPQGDIINLSSDQVVQKVLKGERGVGQFWNQNKREINLTAYEKVDGYGVGVLISQAEQEAFAARNQHIRFDFLVYGSILLLDIFLVIIIIKILNNLSYDRRKEKIFLRSIGDGVVAINRNWEIISWNKSAGRISGWEENEVIGRPFREIIKFIRESDRKENIIFIEEAMLYGKPVQMQEGVVLITKDKKEVPVGDTAAPIIDEMGNTSGAIIIFRDVTKERESMMIRSDFAYASHQMRTPVNEALWSIESALKSRSLKSMREALEVAHLSISKMRKSVSSLIEVSRIDQNMVSLRIQSEKVADLLEDAINSVSDDARKNNINIKIPTISSVAGLQTDAILLKRILNEILENAILYSKKKGTVNISIDFQQGGVLFEISDDGMGIPEEQKSLIFNKFFRGQNVPSNIIGSGLGLYIAKGYIKLLNGKIWFKSEEGKGTTFSIFLPNKAIV